MFTARVARFTAPLVGRVRLFASPLKRNFFSEQNKFAIVKQANGKQYKSRNPYAYLLAIPIVTIGGAMCAHHPVPVVIETFERPTDQDSVIVVTETPGGVEIQDRLGRISFGLVLGFVAGYAAKKIGKAVLFAAGTFFLVIQYLAFRGYLTVHWGAVARRSRPITEPEERKAVLRTMVSILTHNLLLKTGFFSGLAIGFKYG